MKISVVCGSRANDTKLLLTFLQSLENQTFQDFDVNIVCDRRFSHKEESDFLSFFKSSGLNVAKRTHFFTNNNSEFNPDHKGGASFVRNFGISKATGEFIQLFDDDNVVDPDFLEKCLDKREQFTKKTKSECLILPSIYYRNTTQIQNQGFSHFNYFQSRPIPNFLKGKPYSQIQMFSGNGLFSLASTFRKSKYDEQIARISEDLDYTLSLHEKGVQLRVFSDLKVYHNERDKTRLEHSRIGSYSQAKQKARNRFLFTKKHGTRHQLYQFYLFGLPGCVVRLSIKAILYGGKDAFQVIKGIFAGVKEGRKLVKNAKN